MSRRQPSGNRQLTDPAHAGETRCPAPATPRHGTRSPHAPSPVGAVTAKEARPHLGTKLVIVPASLAAGPCQPGIEATPRDTERLAHPQHWPYPSVLRDEAELHVDSFAK